MSASLPSPKYHAEEIERRVDDIARRIATDYRGRELVLVAILKGAIFFLSDLSRKLTVPHRFEFINVVRREGGGHESTEIDFTTPLAIEGRHVVILKDVVNTGVIETYLTEQLQNDRPVSIRFAAIADKPQERRSSVLVDYSLFTVAEEGHLVGYGMEHDGAYAHLPYVALLPQ